MFPQPILIIVIILSVWLILLSIILWRIHKKFSSIFKGEDEQSAVALLHKLVSENNHHNKEIGDLVKKVNQLEQRSLEHIQRIGLLRFNPFRDTGGDQSFVVSLVDAKNTGLVISGLYSRSGTRWYAKKVIAGKGVEHELSEEEKKAIVLAK